MMQPYVHENKECFQLPLSIKCGTCVHSLAPLNLIVQSVMAFREAIFEVNFNYVCMISAANPHPNTLGI